MLLAQIASAGNITVVRDGTFETLGVLRRPEQGMLVFLEHAKFLPSVRRMSEATCVITTPAIARAAVGAAAVGAKGLATSDTPRWAFHRIHAHLALKTAFYWTDFKTEIHSSARIHPRAVVAKRNVRIGPGTVVEANATIDERCIIGAHVTIRSGAVLGSAGFQTIRTEGRVEEMVHAGGVAVDDGAHILANAVVAPAIFRSFTRIGAQARVGNCACISHGVQLGARSHVGHGSVVCGYAAIGSDVWVGPGATLTNNITVGDGANVTIGAVVIRDVKPGQRVAGNFAVAHRALLKHVATLR